MWIWKRININRQYKEIILNAFPGSLREDVKEVITVLPFNHNVLYRAGQVIKMNTLIHADTLSVLFNNEVLKIPSRIYFNEPEIEKEKHLSDLQKTILNCFYLRHHNGFVRQSRLELLLDRTEDFITPYTLHLLGEYVFQILAILNQHINSETIKTYVDFISQNEKLFIRAESRMISYWNVYYRGDIPKLDNYIGMEIATKLRKAIAQHRFAASPLPNKSSLLSGQNQ